VFIFLYLIILELKLDVVFLKQLCGRTNTCIWICRCLWPGLIMSSKLITMLVFLWNCLKMRI